MNLLVSFNSDNWLSLVNTFSHDISGLIIKNIKDINYVIFLVFALDGSWNTVSHPRKCWAQKMNKFVTTTDQ